MKTLLFILFFPITVPVWLLYKLIPLLFNWIVDTFIPFLQYDVFPLIKRFIKKINKNKEDIQTTYGNDSRIDYLQYPLAESDDPLFIRALAVASYEKIFTPYTLQRELKISYNRAVIIITQLLNSHLVSSYNDDKYCSNVSFEYFNILLEKLIHEEYDNQKEDYEDCKIKNTPTDTDKLFQEYSYKYQDISYEKKSKIVSIFTDKWRKICQQDFVVLDFETTGLSYVDDRIIEIAAIRYNNCVETEKFVFLVNPLRPIPPEATSINKITNEMVADADTERYLIPQLIEFLSDSLIVAHNANFDLHFLEVAARRCGYDVKYNYIDTISVSKKLFPGLVNYKLSTIADALGFDVNCLHRAENDVTVCAEIIKIALDSQ